VFELSQISGAVEKLEAQRAEAGLGVPNPAHQLGVRAPSGVPEKPQPKSILECFEAHRMHLVAAACDRSLHMAEGLVAESLDKLDTESSARVL